MLCPKCIEYAKSMSDSDINNPSVVRSRLINLLSRRDHSVAELQQKLLAKQFSSAIIESQIEQLIKEGYQCNQRYAQSTVREQYRRGKGPMYIRAYLQQRRVTAADIQIAIDNEDIDWFEHAKVVRLKKYTDDDVVDLKIKQRCYRYLAQRGFSSEHINYALEKQP